MLLLRLMLDGVNAYNKLFISAYPSMDRTIINSFLSIEKPTSLNMRSNTSDVRLFASGTEVV